MIKFRLLREAEEIRKQRDDLLTACKEALRVLEHAHEGDYVDPRETAAMESCRAAIAETQHQSPKEG